MGHAPTKGTGGIYPRRRPVIQVPVGKVLRTRCPSCTTGSSRRAWWAMIPVGKVLRATHKQEVEATTYLILVALCLSNSVVCRYGAGGLQLRVPS
jgi:hypothetical protein